jgi:hypothetical protein
MRLELNVNCHSGHVAVDVLPGDPSGWVFDAMNGYGAEASRVEHVDCVRHQVCWDGRDMIAPTETGTCFLRIRLRQGSLFSYRWHEMD